MPPIEDIAGVGLGIWNALSQNRAEKEARARGEQQYTEGYDELRNLRLDQMLQERQAGQHVVGRTQAENQRALRELGGFTGGMQGQYGALTGGLTGEWNQYADKIPALYGGMMGRNMQVGEGITSDLTGGYRSRLGTAMGMLEGSGQQERRDINRQFEELGGAQEQRLAQQGLGGTTIGANLAQGRARQQSDALGGLEERLRQQRIGTYAGLSGEALGAERGLRENQLGRELGIMGQHAGARERTGAAALGAGERLGSFGLANQERLGMMPISEEARRNSGLIGMQDAVAQRFMDRQGALTGNVTNWIGNRQDIPPSQANYLGIMGGLGGGLAQPPQYETSILDDLLGAGFDVANTALLGGMLR